MAIESTRGTLISMGIMGLQKIFIIQASTINPASATDKSAAKKAVSQKPYNKQ